MKKTCNFTCKTSIVSAVDVLRQKNQTFLKLLYRNDCILKERIATKFLMTLNLRWQTTSNLTVIKLDTNAYNNNHETYRQLNLVFIYVS